MSLFKDPPFLHKEFISIDNCMCYIKCYAMLHFWNDGNQISFTKKDIQKYIRNGEDKTNTAIKKEF